MRRCVFCQAELESGARFCRSCGRAQPVSGPIPVASSGALSGRCPSCGEVLPLSARFCANCGQSFSGEIVLLPLGPASGSLPTAPAAPGVPQIGMPHVPNAPAGPQSGALSVPTAPAGPQSGATAVPTAPTSPQSGMLHGPGAPGGPQTGGPSVPTAPAPPPAGTPGSVPTAPTGPGAPPGTLGSAPAQPGTPGGPPDSRLSIHAGRAARMASKTAARGGSSKLLGTVAGKIVATVIAVAVVAAGGTAVAVATGHNPLPALFHGAASTAGPGAAHHPTPTPTPIPPPPELTYIGSDGNVWDMTLPSGSPRHLTGDAKPGDPNTGAGGIVYFGLAWSPDGKRLAFGRSSGSQDSPQLEMRILSAQGTVLLHVPLPDTPAAGANLPQSPDDQPFAWSLDGRFIAYRSTLYTTNAAGDSLDGFSLFESQTGSVVKHFTFDRAAPSGCGNGPVPLTDALSDLHHAHFGLDTFAWSPDQQTMLVAYNCYDNESALLHLGSGKVTRGYPEGASYQPGGNLILGDWPDTNSGTAILGIVDASNQHVRTLVSERVSGSSGAPDAPGTYETVLEQAVWSSDGQRVYYEDDDGIWQVDMDGSHAQRLVAGTPFDNGGMRLSMLRPSHRQMERCSSMRRCEAETAPAIPQMDNGIWRRLMAQVQHRSPRPASGLIQEQTTLVGF